MSRRLVAQSPPRLLPLAVAAALLLGGARVRAADPTTADCLVASDASLKLGNERKLRAQRSQLLMCAQASCPADIRKECTTRVDELNAQIPTIIFQVKDPAGADLSAVKVTMDGEVLAPRLEGTALSIDPGEHTFTFEIAGQPPVSKGFVIRETEKGRRERITIGAPAAEPPVSPEPAPASGEERSSATGLGAQRTLALVAGGVGVLGLGIGAVFGVTAISKHNDAAQKCPDLCADGDGVKAWDAARTAGNLSTVGFIVGAVALAGGAALWLTAPASPAGATRVGVGPGGIVLRRSW